MSSAILSFQEEAVDSESCGLLHLLTVRKDRPELGSCDDMRPTGRAVMFHLSRGNADAPVHAPTQDDGRMPVMIITVALIEDYFAATAEVQLFSNYS